jgi:hypothetical protein
LPPDWFCELSASLAALRAYPTDRRFLVHDAEEYGYLLSVTYRRLVPAGYVPDFGTEHIDLNWKNITAPRFQILDMEHWCVAVTGYGAAYAEAAQRETEHATRTKAYEPGRSQARLALLEQQALLATFTMERDGITTREMFAAMADKAREQRLAQLARDIARTSACVDELSQLVGDAESVPDANGWMASERREYALDLFAARRVTEVRELRERVKSRQAELKDTKGRIERAKVRSELRKGASRLEFLEAIAPLTAAEMCSECVSPANWHSFMFEVSEASVDRGPCPSWPLWQQRVQKAREILFSSTSNGTTPRPLRPQPLAVIPSDLPIEEVITRLTAIQADHPGATVRHGSRNRWEIRSP